MKGRKLVGIAVGFAVVVITVWIFSYIDSWQRDLTTNHARLSESADDPLLQPLESSDSVSQLSQRVLEFVAGQPHWSLESQTIADDKAELHLTRRTAIFRYIDDIRVSIVPSDNGSRMDAESRSRVGKGDLGQNPRNLKELVAGIDSRDNPES